MHMQKMFHSRLQLLKWLRMYGRKVAYKATWVKMCSLESEQLVVRYYYVLPRFAVRLFFKDSSSMISLTLWDSAFKEISL